MGLAYFCLHENCKNPPFHVGRYTNPMVSMREANTKMFGYIDHPSRVYGSLMFFSFPEELHWFPFLVPKSRQECWSQWSLWLKMADHGGGQSAQHGVSNFEGCDK